MFLWEAFVAGTGKAPESDSLPGDRDVRDAVIAAELFAEESRRGKLQGELPPANEVPVMSTIGASLLRAGWSDDPNLLRQDCVVVKASPQ